MIIQSWLTSNYTAACQWHPLMRPICQSVALTSSITLALAICLGLNPLVYNWYKYALALTGSIYLALAICFRLIHPVHKWHPLKRHICQSEGDTHSPVAWNKFWTQSILLDHLMIDDGIWILNAHTMTLTLKCALHKCIYHYTFLPQEMTLSQYANVHTCLN